MLVNISGIYFHIFEIPLIIFLFVFSSLEIYKNGPSILVQDTKYFNLIILLLLLYIFSVTLSVYNAIDKMLVIKSTFKWIEILIFSLLIFFYTSDKDKYRNVYLVFIASNLIALLLPLTTVVSNQKIILAQRLFPGYESVFTYSLILPFIKIKNNKIILFFIFLCITSTLLSFSRGAYLALTFVTLFYAIFEKIKFKKYISTLIIALIIVISLVMYFNISSDLDFLLNRLHLNANLERITLVNLAFEAFFNNPLTGVGSLNFPIYSFSGNVPIGIGSTNLDTLGPHNTFLQVLAEEGIVGFITFSMLIYALMRALKATNEISVIDKKYLLGLKLFFVAFIINISLGFITSQSRFYFALFIGLVLSLNRIFFQVKSET